MFRKITEKAKAVLMKAKEDIIKVETTPASDILCEQRGSGLVEYAGIAIVGLVLILVVVLPAMKTMFNVDIFPGLTDKVTSILNFN